MHIREKFVRRTFTVLIGLFIAWFGVFIFSDFLYRGNSLQDSIFPLIGSGSFNGFWNGIYQLCSSGFACDWFSEFSSSNLQLYSFGGILFGETVWAAVLTWFTTGFLVGIIIKGFKKGLIWSAILLGLVVFFWLLTAILAQVDISTILMANILNTLGELFTVVIFILPGGILGGLLSGPEVID